MIWYNAARMVSVTLLVLAAGQASASDADFYNLLVDQKSIPGYEMDLDRLMSTIGMADLRSFEAEANRLLQKWSSANPLAYYDLAWRTSQALSSRDFRAPRQYDLADIYALQALRLALKPGAVKMPIMVEAGLVRQLQYSKDQTPAKEDASAAWVQQRLEKSGLWLRLLKRLATEIDPRFDPSQPPPSYAPLPEGVSLPPGIAPDAITDLKARAEYEQSLREHEKQVAEFNRQYQLHKLSRRCHKLAVRFIAEAYSMHPHAPEELEALLQEHISDGVTRQEILSTYTERIRQKSPR